MGSGGPILKREEFLDAVRRATARGRSHHIRVRTEFPDTFGRYAEFPDRVGRFLAEVEAAGGQPCRADGLSAARQRLRELLVTTTCKSALCWEHPTLVELGLSALLDELNIRRLDKSTLADATASGWRQAALDADVGITGVDVAVAESGSIIVSASPGRERVASLLPPVHIAVVHQAQVVSDLFDVFERLDPGSLASNLVIITGPSKTGDLELTLTTGVHGPGTLHVIVVDEIAS